MEHGDTRWLMDERIRRWQGDVAEMGLGGWGSSREDGRLGEAAREGAAEGPVLL